MVPDTTNKQTPLIAEKYPQGDLFVCDVADAVLKDIMPQMEHPFYSLSKKPERKERLYKNGDNWLRVTPSIHGLATIYDKDILIYCISQVMASLKQGEDVLSRRIRINSAELLRFTNRGVSGRDYMALDEALERLRGTTISTNIRTGDEVQTDMFGLIDSASVRRKYGYEGRLLWCEIVLSEWVFNAIKANEVLTLHRDYFRLRKPLERRVYELARKHCGQQSTWKISLDLLLKKSGSQSPVKKFRYLIKHLTASNHLPDYTVSFDIDTDMVMFNNRHSMPKDRARKNRSAHQSIHPDTFERVAALGIKQDKYVLEQEFRQWVEKQGITVRDMDALFLEFCRGRRVTPTT